MAVLYIGCRHFTQLIIEWENLRKKFTQEFTQLY